MECWVIAASAHALTIVTSLKRKITRDLFPRIEKMEVAGAVLGPRPGKAICSFCEGRMEILLWILAALVRCIIS